MRVFNDMQEQQLAILFERYISKTASEAEKKEFFELIQQPGSDEILQQLAERYPVPESLLHQLPGEASSQILEAILGSEDQATITVPLAPAGIRKQSVPFIRRFRWLAAACFVLLAGIGSYLLFFRQNFPSKNIHDTNIAGDIKAPGKNKAMITLSGGQKIYLDNAGNGGLARQAGVQVVKLADGQIKYIGTSTELSYNTLTNPNGSKVIDMTLSDGSRIWLNAGSSITYPVAFADNTRKVSMTGEAYFEISHDERKPFIVQKGDMQVIVAGTHFNINAFDDEKVIRVTLLEGSVKVNNGKTPGLLKPGEQAQISDKIKIISGADLEQIMAWKNGLFSFKGTDVKSIMRQLARWYDMEVYYASGVLGDETITGDIPRTANVSEVMKMLEFAGVHFKIEGKSVTVKP